MVVLGSQVYWLYIGASYRLTQGLAVGGPLGGACPSTSPVDQEGRTVPSFTPASAPTTRFVAKTGANRPFEAPGSRA